MQVDIICYPEFIFIAITFVCKAPWAHCRITVLFPYHFSLILVPLKETIWKLNLYLLDLLAKSVWKAENFRPSNLIPRIIWSLLPENRLRKTKGTNFKNDNNTNAKQDQKYNTSCTNNRRPWVPAHAERPNYFYYLHSPFRQS